MAKNITYREFIRRGMLAMELKGQPADVIRKALADLAREWAKRRRERRGDRLADAADVAARLLD